MSQRAMAARAAHAINDMNQLEASSRDKLRTLCMKAPSLLQQSGLAQTVVFLRSRDVGATFVKHLTQVVALPGINSAQALQQEALSEDNLHRYMAMTARVGQATLWLRRLALVDMPRSREGVEHGES